MGRKQIILFFIFISVTHNLAEVDYLNNYGSLVENSVKKVTRYILYDVNAGEGFNLKRDVYMRMATFLKALVIDLDKDDWRLVLPPWTKQWHWKTEEEHASYLWENFFDVASLQHFVPVIEIDQFYKDYGDTVNEVYVLQHYPEFYDWKEGISIEWSTKWAHAFCRDHTFWKNEDGSLKFFRGNKHVKANKVNCISFQGSTDLLESVISSTDAQSIFFDHAEISTHMIYGNAQYWMCRRSMRFAKHLVVAADVFRTTYLNSTDIQDRTVRPSDWRDERAHRSAIGGPYLGVHLRRQDFIQGRPNEIPSLSSSVDQIIKYLRMLNLTTVFVATDMTAEEYDYVSISLENSDYKSVKYDTTQEEKSLFNEGGLAIVDQIIASHARFFVGTYESTFTYRIQEEREIMGFPPNSTFNRFCPESAVKNCASMTQWLIKYPNEEPFKPSTIKHPKHVITDEL